MPQPDTHKFEDYVFDAETAQLSYRDRCAVAEEGYYFIANHILYYYDIRTDAMFPLCTKESCAHRDKNCNAYVYWADGEMGSWVSNCDYYDLVTYEGSLIMFSRDDKWDLYACRYQYDFAQRKQLGRLTRSTAEPRILAVGLPSTLVNKGWLYYVSFVYDTEKMQNQECDTLFTLCRVRLEEGAVPEELYTFDFPVDYDLQNASEYGVQVLPYQDDIYCVAAFGQRVYQTENQVQQRIIRYNEETGAELIWSYTGDERVNFFGSEGEGPLLIYPAVLNENGELMYMTGEDAEYHSSAVEVSKVNLISHESQVIYRTPYRWIEQLSTDGKNYYFLEVYNLEKDQKFSEDASGYPR